MTATRTLIIGTAGGEFTVSGGGTDNAITPTNILIKKQSNHGAANVDAIAVGNATLFLQRAKRKIRELAYNFDVDGYIAPDMTILAEHISEGGLTQIAYQQEPNQIVYGVRGDGELVGLTYQREQQVTAWHRHILGGKSDTTKNIVQQQISFTANGTIVSTSNNTITLSSHGLSTNDPIYYYAAANPITGISSFELMSAARFAGIHSSTHQLAPASWISTASAKIDLASLGVLP